MADQQVMRGQRDRRIRVTPHSRALECRCRRERRNLVRSMLRLIGT
jgi:hypothetical protein